MEEKLHKAMKSKLNTYVTKCANLKDQNRVIPLDDIGRKALKAYFRKNKDKVSPQDSKFLSIINRIIQTNLFNKKFKSSQNTLKCI